METDFQTSQQTVKSNENKLERMQDLIDRTSTSVNSLVATTQSLLDGEQSRDHSTTNELRDLRQNLSQSSLLVRTVQVRYVSVRLMLTYT